MFNVNYMNASELIDYNEQSILIGKYNVHVLLLRK